MKHYTPDTPRVAFAIAALTIALLTLLALVAMPTLVGDFGATASAARTRGAIVVKSARNDLRTAGEMYARANAVPATETR